jgi:hypothetical protein
MDNRNISIQSEGREAFDLSFQLLFDCAPGKKATHYKEDIKKGLIFFWHEEPGATKLLIPMGWKDCSNLAWSWLNSLSDDRYGEYLDHDGSNGKGFRVYNENWSRINDYQYSFMAVLPIWAWYGK